jgi:hypothetical protein
MLTWKPHLNPIAITIDSRCHELYLASRTLELHDIEHSLSHEAAVGRKWKIASGVAARPEVDAKERILVVDSVTREAFE